MSSCKQTKLNFRLGNFRIFPTFCDLMILHEMYRKKIVSLFRISFLGSVFWKLTSAHVEISDKRYNSMHHRFIGWCSTWKRNKKKLRKKQKANIVNWCCCRNDRRTTKNNDGQRYLECNRPLEHYPVTTLIPLLIA